MQLWFEILPWLATMLVLLAFSAFFSASEAAFFSLRQPERRKLATGTRSQQLAASLLSNPDRLLSTVLFWNLMVNMAYFAVTSIVGLRLENNPSAGSAAAYVFAAASLLSIIFFSEMLPKTLAVLAAKPLAGVFAPPLAIAVRVVAPILPALQLVNLFSRRLIWPRFQPEPYLDVADLGRAIDVSTTDAQLAEQERMVLNNIVAMSGIRVDEWMRPRTQFLTFRPPVSWQDLDGQMTPSGYLLITDPDGGEVSSAIDLQNLCDPRAENLERDAIPVVYLPWCATVADAFQQLHQQERDVVAVVNEFGDTIGILTYEDILDTAFTDKPSRSFRLTHREPVECVGEGIWHVTGVTGLRRLARELNVEFPPSRNSTVAGILQETLHRLPVEGDTGAWGSVQFRVLDVADRASMLVEVMRRPTGTETEDAS